MPANKDTTDLPITVKRCTKCGEEKPRTAEYFHGRRDSKDGFRSWCKICNNADSNAKYHDPLSSRLPTWHEQYWQPTKTTATKVCTKCKVEKPWTVEYFYRNSGKSVGLQYQCKICKQSRVNGWASQRPEYFRNYYRKKTPQQKQQARINLANRRARKKSLPATFTQEQWQFCLQYWNYTCAICGKQDDLFGLALSQEHWVPLASPDCPGTVATNILCLCNGEGGCNTRKNRQEGKAWLEVKLGKRRAAKKLQEIYKYFSLINICK